MQERGEQTPRAQRSGAEVDRKSRRRGGKQSKLRRLLDFQTSLCGRCGLAPTRLMMEMRVASRRTGEGIRLTRMRRRKKVKVGAEEQLQAWREAGQEGVRGEGVLEPELGMREKETPEPDAGLVRREEEGEVGSEGEIVGAGPLPPQLETVTASGNYFPYTLRQSHVGDMVEDGLPG